MASPSLLWLEPDAPFPPVDQALGEDSGAPGLLAAGDQLDAARLRSAYAQGIFPWFSPGQPVLWWSPDPRMVLKVADFKLHRSLKKTLRQFLQSPGCEIRFDSAFGAVIQKCAQAPREGQNGTWIVPAMVQAYCDLHAQGLAHSVETWIDGELVAGLYCVSIGKAVCPHSSRSPSRYDFAGFVSPTSIAAIYPGTLRPSATSRRTASARDGRSGWARRQASMGGQKAGPGRNV